MTFVCRSCNVPLCLPVLVERTQAQRDCFRLFHEEIFRTSDFSVESLEDIEPYDSEDDFDVTHTNAQCDEDTNDDNNCEINYAEV